MLSVRAIELRDANAFVAKHHRHHRPVVGHRFSLAAYDGDRLCGVAIVGRPVARMTDHATTLEVTRLATDGTYNACSILYAAAARAGRALGYERIQTFILETEPGTSLRASGWSRDGTSGGGQWNHPDEPWLFSGPNRRTDQPTCRKERWSKVLRAAQDEPDDEEAV